MKIRADDLVRGSEELNRMKNEIRTVLCVLSGAFPAKSYWELREGVRKKEVCCTPGDYWVIEARSVSAIQWAFSFFRKGQRLYIKDEQGETYDHGLKDVAAVHASLNYLVEGAVNDFPGASDALTPYCYASLRC